MNQIDIGGMVVVYQRALQRIMQVLGPDVPTDVDYTDPANAAGLIAEQREALKILREVGIEYQLRKPKKDTDDHSG